MFIKASEKNIKQFLENGCLEEYTRFKITILVFCKTAHMMEHGRLLYLSLKKIMLNIFKVIIKTTNLNNCVKNRDSTWVTESIHLLKCYIPFWKI